MSIPEATAIIVNYHSQPHVVELLDRLRNHPEECPNQIVVVDNSPEDGLCDRPELQGSTIRYLAMERNIGFAAAVNRGLRLADQPWIILLNPDARPESGCLSGLLSELQSVAHAAVAGPRLIPFDDSSPAIPSATRIDPDLGTILVEYTLAHRLPGARDWLDRRYFADPSGGEPVDVAMVQGACFVFGREWADRVGDFDEDRFFLYWEETDFCRRVRSLGGRIRFCPQLECRHLGGASTTDRKEAERHFWRGFHAYLARHRSRPYAHAVRLLLILGVGGEYLILRALGLLRRGRDGKLAADTRAVGCRWRAQFARPAR